MTSSEHVTEEQDGDEFESSDDANENTTPWSAWAFRILISIAATFLFNQAILAGQFMEGTFQSLELHRLGASVAEGVVILAAIAAGIARYRAHYYPTWPLFATILLFVVINVQEFVGQERILSLHVPLGVAIIVSVSFLTAWAWRDPQ